MIEFLRDSETGYVYAYRNGVLVGPVDAMNDNAPTTPSYDLWKEEKEGRNDRRSGNSK